MATKKTGSVKAKKGGSGMAVAALATAAVASVAGAVFLYGTDAGKKKRKQIRSWGIKARGEVLERLEKAKEVNEGVYRDVVKAVVSKYEKVKNVDLNELNDLARELTTGWAHIKRQLSGAPKKKAKKVVSKKVA
jgi:NAD/NADP transhydrogenase alpha subunit